MGYQASDDAHDPQLSAYKDIFTFSFEVVVDGTQQVTA